MAETNKGYNRIRAIGKIVFSFAVAAAIWIITGEGNLGEFVHAVLLGMGGVAAIWLIVKAVRGN